MFKEFGIKLSFVATRSGLTRWEEHKEENEVELEEEEEENYDFDDDQENQREP